MMAPQVLVIERRCNSHFPARAVHTALANLDLIGAWALTEPFNGSDASGLQTTAKKVPGRCGLVSKREGDHDG